MRDLGKVTKEDIESGLRELGLNKGDVVLVHSSLSSFGCVMGGADAVIDALLEVVGDEGTIMVPTLTRVTKSGKSPSMDDPPIFDPENTPCWTGRIPETLRRRKGAIRSLHPTHSITAIGAKAEELLKEHEKAITPCGKGSPYGRLAELDNGYILFLGVTLGCGTLFHHVEEMADVPYHMQKEPVEAEIIERGKRRKVKIKIHAYGTPRNFSRMEPILKKAGVMRMGTIGNSTIRLLKAKEAVNSTLEALKEKDPEILLDKRTRIGIIGCGGIAAAHINAYRENDSANLVSFCDADMEKAKECADKFEGRFYSDYREMIEKERLDGVSICTPPSSHKDIAVTLLSRGINVLCEKPLAISAFQARQMADTATKNNVLLLTAFKFRFFDKVLKARELISQGVIGRVIMFRNMFGGAIDMSKRWFSKREISGGGVLIDNGVHAIDLVRFLFGEVKSVSARIATFAQDIEVEDTARLLLEMENGSLGTVDLSWSIPYPQPFYLEIYGSKGSIMVGGDILRYRSREMKDWIEEKEKLDGEGAFVRQIGHFLNCIKRKETPIVNGIDGLRALEVIEAAYKSNEEKVCVKIHQPK